MRQQELLIEARDLLAQFVTRVRGAAAMGHTDINVISEAFLTDLLTETFDLPGLRNLNREQRNFPGLDLADDAEGVAYQITATSDLSKIKDSLKTVVAERLYIRYPRVRVYVLTEKQGSYSQSAIDSVTQGHLQFDAKSDIQDYRDVLRALSTLPMDRVERAVALLRKQFSPAKPSDHASIGAYLLTGRETVELNLVPIWFPKTLYVADFVNPLATAAQVTTRRRRGRQINPRSLVSREMVKGGFNVPEDFEIHADRVITFHDPAAADSVLRTYVDAGTLTELKPHEYYAIDEDQLRVFKSLLRRAFQRQMRAERIHWQNERHMFFYGPTRDFDERIEGWNDGRVANRTVFQKTMKTNKPEEILTCKHLAFTVDFHLIQNTWYIAIAPTWYFSRDGYHPDPFGAKRISWLKRQENDQQVHTHFRFICYRIRALQERSLFDGKMQSNIIQIGEALSFSNHPVIPDHIWKPPSQPSAPDPDAPVQGKLVD